MVHSEESATPRHWNTGGSISVTPAGFARLLLPVVAYLGVLDMVPCSWYVPLTYTLWLLSSTLVASSAGAPFSDFCLRYCIKWLQKSTCSEYLVRNDTRVFSLPRLQLMKMAGRLWSYMKKVFSTDDFSIRECLLPYIGGYARLVCLRSTDITVEREGYPKTGVWGNVLQLNLLTSSTRTDRVGCFSCRFICIIGKKFRQRLERTTSRERS